VTPDSSNGRAARTWPSSPHEATRFILEHLPESAAVEGSPTEAERLARAEEPAVLIQPDVIGAKEFEAIEVGDPRRLRGITGFAAFLDGVQDIRVVNQSAGIPIVWATVSAAIRARVNRRLVSWNGRAPVVSSRYYIPFCYVDAIREDLRHDPRVVDTGMADSRGVVPSRHPAALMEVAVKKVQQDREMVEQTLAEEWCAAEKDVLYVDGSITSSPVASRSKVAVGVIKSHRRLYAEGEAFNVLVGLKAGHRTSVFRVARRGRNEVASWYVRLRPPVGRDALFGLVRVEAALDDDIASRADEISRWLIAEGAPLALPDGRWDKMAYGIRHTEEFLRAIS
jgi:hypothetical protein